MFYLPNLCGGGAERVSINILNRLNREKYELHLVLGIMEGEALHLLPQDIYVHNLDSARTIYSLFKLRKKIKEIAPDIVFSSLYRTHIALYFSLKTLIKKPKTILRMPSSPKLVFKYNEMSRAFKILLDMALKKADLVIAQTPEMKNEICKYHGINKNKIEVFINPLDTKMIDKKSSSTVSLFDKNYINIVASGRLSHEKGYDILLKAFSKVYQKDSKYRLYIIGADNANEMDKYQEIIKEHSLYDVVKFLGFQENPYSFYKHCDLFVLSSRREGLPNTVLENLYLKKPVVATRCIPFMEELIKDGENGFLVDVENIEQLANAILNFKNLSGSRGFINESILLNRDIFAI